MDMIGNLFIQLFRALFAFIDFIIYGVISLVYNLFIQISDTGIFGNDVFQRFSTRIYSIIGIVMLFKLAFSLITYIVNPDEFSSKDKGMGKLITNIMITLVLIVITPTIFREAFNLQRIIIKENVIGQLILGDVLRQSENNKVDDGWYQAVGDEMAFTIARAFVVPTTPECKDVNWDDPDSTNYKDCIGKISGKNGDQAFIEAFSGKKSSALFNLGLINAMNEGVFLVDYTMLISTIAGGLTAWIFFIFCIDIATRSVKLAFLQLVAPVPIISYIDPKSGKSGIFSKWVKECLKTFADLFVRILAIYFCIFVISELARSPQFIISSCDETMNNCAVQTNPLVIVFIILGVLMFAGKLPKLIEDMFGVKMGGFTLNPMKKLGQSPVAAAAVGGLVGGIGGFAGNTAALAASIKKDGWQKTFVGDKTGVDAVKQAVTRGYTGVGGLIGGARRGIAGGVAAGGKGSAFKVGTDAMTGASNARNLRWTGYGTADKARDRFTNYAGIKNNSGTSSALGDRVKQASQRVEDSKAIERRVEQMKAALSQKARSDVAIGEFNRVAHFGYKVDPNDETKIIRDYDFDPMSMYTTSEVDGVMVEKLDSTKVQALYDRYASDASKRGMSDTQRLSQAEFIEAMDLERQGWEQDKATKKLEKELKGAQEDESLAKPKKS